MADENKDLNMDASLKSFQKATGALERILYLIQRIGKEEARNAQTFESWAEEQEESERHLAAVRNKLLDDYIEKELKTKRTNYADKQRMLDETKARQEAVKADIQEKVKLERDAANAYIKANEDKYKDEKSRVDFIQGVKRKHFDGLNVLQKRAWLTQELEEQKLIREESEARYAAMDKRTKDARALAKEIEAQKKVELELEKRLDGTQKQRLTKEERILVANKNKKKSLEEQEKLSKEILSLEGEAKGANSPKERKSKEQEIRNAKKELAYKAGEAMHAEAEEKRSSRKSFQERVREARDNARASIGNFQSNLDNAGYHKGAGFKDNLGPMLKGGLQSISDSLEKNSETLKKMYDKIGAQMGKTYENQGALNARLQGSDARYQKMVGKISSIIGMSPTVSLSKTTENLSKLIETGTNYNLELRAYIQTATENIAKTFDAFDAELLRLIRVQQSDSTAARMGMEAGLTQYLNSTFSDTSYLTDVRDSVTGTLLDTSALMNKEAAAEFEFTVQKWLGALYSLGLSKEAATNIASGINLIGTGNIDSLSGNDALMTLMSMSAVRSGQSIGDLLNQGLNANTTNKLLHGMVNYLAEIAGNTDLNNVTRAAYSNVLGITTTDLRTIQNLSSTDIKSIADTVMTYNSMNAEAEKQISQISNRMHLSQMMANITDNLFLSAANNIGSTAVTYAMWQVLNAVNQQGGVVIPGIQAMGTGTSSTIDVTQIMQAGMAGLSLLGSVIGGIGGIFNGGAPALSRFGGMDTVKRGTGIDLTNGIQSGFSESTQYTSRGSGSSDDIEQSALDESGKKGKDANKTMGADEDPAADAALKFYQEGLVYLENICNLLGVMTYTLGYTSAEIPAAAHKWITKNNSNSSSNLIDILQTSNTSTQTALLVQSANGVQAMNVQVIGFSDSATSSLKSNLLPEPSTTLFNETDLDSLESVIKTALSSSTVGANITGIEQEATIGLGGF